MKAYLALFDTKARELTASWSGGLEDLVLEMKKYLPPRSRAEWLIGASLRAKYLRVEFDSKN